MLRAGRGRVQHLSPLSPPLAWPHRAVNLRPRATEERMQPGMLARVLAFYEGAFFKAMHSLARWERMYTYLRSRRCAMSLSLCMLSGTGPTFPVNANSRARSSLFALWISRFFYTHTHTHAYVCVRAHALESIFRRRKLSCLCASPRKESSRRERAHFSRGFDRCAGKRSDSYLYRQLIGESQESKQ